MHAEVARLDHLGLAPIKLPVLQQVALEPDRLRHGNLVLLPGAAEEHGAHILSSHDWEFDPQRVANRRGLEEVYASTNGEPLNRPDTRVKLTSLISCWEERTDQEQKGVTATLYNRREPIYPLLILCRVGYGSQWRRALTRTTPRLSPR